MKGESASIVARIIKTALNRRRISLLCAWLTQELKSFQVLFCALACFFFLTLHKIDPLVSLSLFPSQLLPVHVRQNGGSQRVPAQGGGDEPRDVRSAAQTPLQPQNAGPRRAAHGSVMRRALLHAGSSMSRHHTCTSKRTLTPEVSDSRSKLTTKDERGY